jgi:hypothetical protein
MSLLLKCEEGTAACSAFLAVTPIQSIKKLSILCKPKVQDIVSVDGDY